MHKCCNLIFGLFFCGSTACAASLGNTLFTITPSETTLYLSSNGSGNVVYTLTNNAKVNVTPSITLAYQSSGNNLTMGTNTCNSALAPNTSCTFQILISGANQPASFTITPRVCGFSGFMCSIPRNTLTVIVTTPAAGLPSRAYEEVIISPYVLVQITLLGINIHNTSDQISYPRLGTQTAVNSVVVSPDARHVYATENLEPGPAVAFFDVTSDGLTKTQNVILRNHFRHYTDAPQMQMALTPNGSTLFITLTDNLGSELYRIDLTTDVHSAISIDDPDHIFTGLSGLVVSPDATTVYVGTNQDYLIALPVNAVRVDSNNKIAEGAIPMVYHIGLAIDSAGNKLYAGNQDDGSVSILSVNGLEAQFDRTILNDGGFSDASGLAISPDGNTLYVAETGNDSVAAVSLANDATTLVQPEISGAFGLALSPDGSLLYVTQRAEGASTTTVLNAVNFFAIPTTIEIGGHSQTIGQFIGP